jgi:dienelactone hydrolase
MASDGDFDYDAGEPLGLQRTEAAPPARWPALRTWRFEFSSRGDRVPGRLLLPPRGEGPFPVVLLQHGRGGSKQAPYIEAAAGPWAERGAAVATIDFPLHGERSSAKLSEALVSRLAEAGATRDALRLLTREFFHQAVIDLRRAVDVLEVLPETDSGRLAYGAFSLGTVVGASFCGVDPRPRAAALAIGGGGSGGPAFDPALRIAGFAPRPALFLNTTGDEVFSRESARALFDGAGEPKEQLWFEGAHAELPGAALKAMWSFFDRHLAIS